MIRQRKITDIDMRFPTTTRLAIDMLNESNPESKVKILFEVFTRKGKESYYVNITEWYFAESNDGGTYVLYPEWCDIPWYDKTESPLFEFGEEDSKQKYLVIVNRDGKEEPEVVYFDGQKWNTDEEILYWMEIPE